MVSWHFEYIRRANGNMGLVRVEDNISWRQSQDLIIAQTKEIMEMIPFGARYRAIRGRKYPIGKEFRIVGYKIHDPMEMGQYSRLEPAFAYLLSDENELVRYDNCEAI